MLRLQTTDSVDDIAVTRQIPPFFVTEMRYLLDTRIGSTNSLYSRVAYEELFSLS